MKRKNDQIESRNKARLQFARALESPDITLRRKVGTTTSVVIQMWRNCGITSFETKCNAAAERKGYGSEDSNREGEDGVQYRERYD